MTKEGNKKIKGKEISLLKNIHDKTPRPWTIKITVLEKTTIRDARDTPTKYQRFVVADSEGTKVQLTLFNSNISMFSDRLELSKKYLISNAKITTVDAKYQIGDYPFQLMLHKACVIDEVSDNEPNEVLHAYNFTAVDDFYKFKDASSTIDVLVVVIQVLAKKTVNTKNGKVPVQEFIVIDNKMKPVVLTIWDSLIKKEVAQITDIVVEKPIVACMRVIVNQYDGLSISSKGAGTFMINPSIPDALDLRAWLFDNMSSVDALLNNANLESMARTFGNNVTNEISSVLNVLQQTQLKLFHVKGTLKIVDYGQRFLYMCCSFCNKSTTAAYKESYTCNSCAEKAAISLPRLCVEVLFNDSTGSIQATLFGDHAEKIIGCSADTLMQNQLLENPKSIESILSFNEENDMLLQLKVYQSEYRGSRTRKFIASLLDQVSDVNVLDVVGEGCSQSQFPMETSNNSLVFDDDELSLEEKKVLQNIAMRKKLKQEQVNQNVSIDILSPRTKDAMAKLAQSSDNNVLKDADNVGDEANIIHINSLGVDEEPTDNMKSDALPSKEKYILDDEEEFNKLMEGPVDKTSRAKRKLVLHNE